MIRPRRRVWPLSGIVILNFLACLSGLLTAGEARAASNDAEALKLRQAAIEQDYLATDFASAEKKLAQALALCKVATDCAPATRGRIHCDLGVVYYGQQKKDEADAQFAAAAKADPNVTISPDLTTPELQKELAAVKAGKGASAEPSGEPGPDGAAAAATAEGSATATTEGPAKSSRPAPESDCPPGFPGCKGAGASGATCTTNDDCSGGETCQEGACSSGHGDEGEQATAKANWLSVAIGEDFLLLPSANKVCAGNSGYTCFDSNGNYDAQVPASNSPPTSDTASGGFAAGTTRIMLGYDRAFGSNATLGARVGFAFGGGPTRPGAGAVAFMPLHAELKGAYWFGKNALARKGFRFFVLAAGGVAEVDASETAYVFNTNSPNGAAATQYTAWKKTGQGFIGAGLGTMFAFGASDGITLEVRAMELLPTSGTAVGLQLGYMHGL